MTAQELDQFLDHHKQWLQTHKDYTKRGITPLITTVLTCTKERMDQYEKELHAAIEIGLPDVIEHSIENITKEEQILDYMLAQKALCKPEMNEPEVLSWDEIVSQNGDNVIAVETAQDMADFDDSVIATLQEENSSYIGARQELLDTDKQLYLEKTDSKEATNALLAYENKELSVDNVVRLDKIKKQIKENGMQDLDNDDLKAIIHELRKDISHQQELIEKLTKEYEELSSQVLKSCNDKDYDLDTIYSDAIRTASDNCKNIGSKFKDALSKTTGLFQNVTQKVRNFRLDNVKSVQTAKDVFKEIQEEFHKNKILSQADILNSYSSMELKMADRQSRRFGKYVEIDRKIHDQKEEINKLLNNLSAYEPYQKKQYEPSEIFQRAYELQKNSTTASVENIDTLLKWSDIVKKEAKAQRNFNRKEEITALVDKVVVRNLNKVKRAVLTYMSGTLDEKHQAVSEKGMEAQRSFIDHSNEGERLAKEAAQKMKEAGVDMETEDIELE